VINRKTAGVPQGRPAVSNKGQSQDYWRAAAVGVAALAVMGEETRLAALVLV
jgi:hypothetical protein